ncbi:MAG TPA: YeeE/YedE thiosulfate transporter family protein [Anaeromyxobacter sp.]|nr:YeeE/YedE thiosulfate transporter family protein [Anaeromyxobacter sp.]
MRRDPDRFWNPYLGGVALGLVLLATLVVMGKGLGASSANFRAGVWAVRAIAPEHVASTPALSWVARDRHPLDDWIVLEVLGVAIGGALGAITSGRFGREVLRGPTMGAGGRLVLAVGGGALMGFAARLARGCTSGQALSGGAVMSVGAWAFMLSVFAGGYAMAWFVRRQWR